MTVEEAYKRVNEITDNLGMPIDERIKNTLVGLLINNIETTGSCEGHKKDGEQFPWIDIETPEPDDWMSNSTSLETWKLANQKQVKKLQKLLDEFNEEEVSAYPLKLMPRGIYGAVRLQTGRTKSIADTLPLDYLHELQRQMEAFGDFLLEKKT